MIQATRDMETVPERHVQAPISKRPWVPLGRAALTVRKKPGSPEVEEGGADAHWSQLCHERTDFWAASPDSFPPQGYIMAAATPEITFIIQVERRT